MKHIIHMSDLHVGYKDFDERFGVICDNLIAQKRNQASDCVIVITGDLVDDANGRNSYPMVKRWLEHLRGAGFRHILVVPGNHDYGTGRLGNKKLEKIFKQVFYQDELSYPRKDIIDNIAFIGLDSMASELHFYDKLFSEGELGRSQLKRLNDILNADDVRRCKKRVIYLHHHPFDWRPLHQLKDSSRLKKLLTNAIDSGISIDVLLYGHNHQGKSCNGQWGIARCYDGGTATLRRRFRHLEWLPLLNVKSSIRLINIEEEDTSGDCILSLNYYSGTGPIQKGKFGKQFF